MMARGNEGVASRIKISQGSIGYVEYGFAKRLGLPMAHLQNRRAVSSRPTRESGEAALAAAVAQIPGNLRAFLPDPDGEASYPIVTFTWLLLYGQYAEPGQGGGAQAVRRLGPHRRAALQRRPRLYSAPVRRDLAVAGGVGGGPLRAAPTRGPSPPDRPALPTTSWPSRGSISTKSKPRCVPFSGHSTASTST